MAGLVFLPFVDFRATFIYVDVDWLIGIESAESGISAAFFSRQPVASLDDQKMATLPKSPQSPETSKLPHRQKISCCTGINLSRLIFHSLSFSAYYSFHIERRVSELAGKGIVAC
jgi:hypothetical protein